MKKFIPKTILLLGILIGSIMVCNISYAATSDAMQKYLSGESYFDVKGYKSTAPVEENAAGDEIINNFAGTLNYSTTDFVLEGKNGMNISLTRNLQSNQEITDTRLHYYGFMADFDNEPVCRNKAYLVKYFIDGSTTNYCYVLFRTLEEILAAEDENHSFRCTSLASLTPTTLYSSSEGLNINGITKFCTSAGITSYYRYDLLYSSNPKTDKNAVMIPEVREITPEIEALGGAAGSSLGTGGMLTKLRAAKIATEAGCDMIISNGAYPEFLYKIIDGESVGTRFYAKK